MRADCMQDRCEEEEELEKKRENIIYSGRNEKGRREGEEKEETSESSPLFRAHDEPPPGPRTLTLAVGSLGLAVPRRVGDLRLAKWSSLGSSPPLSALPSSGLPVTPSTESLLSESPPKAVASVPE